MFDFRAISLLTPATNPPVNYFRITHRLRAWLIAILILTALVHASGDDPSEYGRAFFTFKMQQFVNFLQEVGSSGKLMYLDWKIDFNSPTYKTLLIMATTNLIIAFILRICGQDVRWSRIAISLVPITLVLLIQYGILGIFKTAASDPSAGGAPAILPLMLLLFIHIILLNLPLLLAALLTHNSFNSIDAHWAIPALSSIALASIAACQIIYDTLHSVPNLNAPSEVASMALVAPFLAIALGLHEIYTVWRTLGFDNAVLTFEARENGR